MIPKKHWNETVAFWQTPLDWPGDQDDFVFLAKAVLQVERTLFPNAWIDDDPAHSYIALPPICQALGPKLESHQFPDLTDEAFAEISDQQHTKPASPNAPAPSRPDQKP
jgi:hypothetical protein